MDTLLESAEKIDWKKSGLHPEAGSVIMEVTRRFDKEWLDWCNEEVFTSAEVKQAVRSVAQDFYLRGAMNSIAVYGGAVTGVDPDALLEKSKEYVDKVKFKEKG
jgi:hypothetical protein